MGLKPRILLARSHAPLKNGQVDNVSWAQLKLLVQIRQAPHALGAIANAEDLLLLALDHEGSFIRIQDGSTGKSNLLARRKVNHRGLHVMHEEHGLIAAGGTHHPRAVAQE